MTGFKIEASTNFITWNNIGSGYTDTNGSLLFQDTKCRFRAPASTCSHWPLF